MLLSCLEDVVSAERKKTEIGDCPSLKGDDE